MSRNKKNSTGENMAISRLIGDNSGELSAFLQNVLESSMEYSIIGKDLEGKKGRGATFYSTLGEQRD